MAEAILLRRTNVMRLGDILLNQGAITEEDLNKALEKQKETKQFLGEIFIELGILDEQTILQALGKQLNISLINLAEEHPDKHVIKHFEQYAQSFMEHNCIPLTYDNDTHTLCIATNNPLDNDFFNEIAVKLGVLVNIRLAKKEDIAYSINRYYGDYFKQNILNEFALDEDTTETVDTSNLDVDKLDEDTAPMIKLVNSIFTSAVRTNSSDIHIEPVDTYIRVRYRIDGDLHEKEKYPITMLSGIISRIKIMGNMNIAEKRKPQDGRITIRVDDVEYDVRVSVLPTVWGEKAVMRLTNKEKLTMQKSNLGFLPADEKKFDALLKNTKGIILVTGPTGSGKSTTLYTALSELNKENINITTIEDPVEANIEGLNQVAINNDAGMTFPAALRCFLRQDPDIIMVGEIRDKETASLAIDAALTGHLVVSTLHTNSSISAITRLEKMGIEPYLLADAMCGVLAQRLVKRLCPVCKKPKELTIIDRKKLHLNANEHPKIYEPCGCANCNGTGYKGRIAIYEILMFTKELQDAVAEEKRIATIEEIAHNQGLSLLKDSCIEQIKNGVTSIAEMDRVVYENSIEFSEEIFEADTKTEPTPQIQTSDDFQGFA